MLEKIHIENRINILKLRSAQRYNISPDKCHIGHLVLQGLLDNPKMTHQIDVFTHKSESNASVALRSMRLASAMKNYGLKTGDVVAIIGVNHLDIAIPFYANHYNGYTSCGIDPSTTLPDLKVYFSDMMPKIAFCQASIADLVKQAFTAINVDGKVVTFDDKYNNMETFIHDFKGTEVNYRPSEFNQSEVTAWLMLTSGTTGRSKLVVIPYDKLLNSMLCWWEPFTAPFKIGMSLSSFQWISALLMFISTPLRRFTRLQFSTPITPQQIVTAINHYRPEVTIWTPHFLSQFMDATKTICDMSCFKYVCVTGSPIDKTLVDKFNARCENAFLYLVFGMTELLVPGFDYRAETPIGSVGKPYSKYSYRLMDEDGNIVEDAFTNGELHIKGDAFFKEYLNNPEETRKMVTEDGWLKTGDIFYRDEDNNYFFVDRQRLLIRYLGFWIPPIQLESVIKKHPAVKDVCVVGLPNPSTMEIPIAAIVRANGHDIPPNDLFTFIRNNLPELKQLHGGYFYMDSLPVTTTGKINRLLVKELAKTAKRILPQ